MPDSLSKIILERRGFFLRSDALACGVTDRDLRRQLASGTIVRVRHGSYAPANLFAAMDATERYQLLARAVISMQRGRVALTGISAAAFHGLRVYGDLSAVHVLRLDGLSPRTHAGAVHHAAGRNAENEVEEVSGLLITNVVRTVWDVARSSSLEAGVVTADSALGLHPKLAGALAELADRYVRHPESARARRVIRLADGRSGSVGESYTRVQFHRHAVPAPELQYEVRDPRSGALIGISDFYWESCRHLGEFDGKVKYQKYLRPGESPSDAVFREKRREDAMRGGHRGMTRFDWASVMPDQVRRTMASLRSALEQSRQLYVRVPGDLRPSA